MKYTPSLTVALLIATTSYAQESPTVGELLTKGGKKLSRDEVASSYKADVTATGVTPAGNRKFEITYSKDGKLSGRSTDLHGQNGYGLFGTWTINDAGQFCTQIRNTFGRDATPTPPCNYRYRLGDSIYSASSEEPQTPLRMLSISK